VEFLPFVGFLLCTLERGSTIDDVFQVVGRSTLALLYNATEICALQRGVGSLV
jgi:hypothetical protein